MAGIDPERWQVLEDRFHAALDRPPAQRAAFLDEVCAGDQGLRAELEALLSSYAQAGSFLESHPADAAAGSLLETAPSADLDRRIGPYRLLRELGHGGMGTVYLAERADGEYCVRVALKLVDVRHRNLPTVIERFRRERQILANLNHPNICRLLDGGSTEDGVPYLVMEHVGGVPIDEYCDRHRLSIDNRLSLFVDVCAAVECAHRRSIVHRDIKASNILVTADGVPKLLDFGIARILEPDAQYAITQTSLRAMTPECASPEQVRGEPVGPASDVYSLGVLLYRLLTGRSPYKLRTVAPYEITDAICREEPQKPSRRVVAQPGPRESEEAACAMVAAWRQATPASLSRRLGGDLDAIILMALRKEPAARYGSAGDLAADVTRQLARLPVTARRPGFGYLSWKLVTRHKWPLARGGLVLLALAAGVLIASQRRVQESAGRADTPASRQSAAPTSIRATFTRLTSHPDLEYFPSLSPDGKWFVYAADAAGNWDIYLQSVGGQVPINLTTDSTSDDTQPVFSPDGELIVFRSGREGGGLFVMRRTGESVRRVTDFGYNPSWSPDGRELVFGTQPNNQNPFPGLADAQRHEIWVLKLQTGQPRRLTRAFGRQPSWSPGGDCVAYESKRDIWVVPAVDGEPVAVTRDEAIDWNPVWSPDGKYLYFESNREGTMNVWRVPIDEVSGKTLGPPEPISAPSPFTASLSFAADGRRFVYSSVIRRDNIQKVPFDPSAERVVGNPRSVTVGSRSWIFPALSPDGEHVALWSWFAQEDIYTIRSDGRGETQLTNDAAFDRLPRWSPDGRRIAFYSNRSGKSEIWVINSDGSNLRQLTETTEDVTYPVWSPDGSRMAATGSGGRDVWLFDPNRPWSEQSPEKLPPPAGTDSHFRAFSWSPDGKRLAGQGGSTGLGSGIIVFSLESRSYARLTDAGTWPVWLSDSRRLLLHTNQALSLLDSRSGQVREILSIPDDGVSAPAVTRDDRWIYFYRRTEEADIWMGTVKQ